MRTVSTLPQLRKGGILGGDARGDSCTSRTESHSRETALFNVCISRRGLVGRGLTTPEETVLAQRLRYRVFVEKLKWVSGHNGLDVDEHDDKAVGFGVFEGPILRGTFRITLPDHPFMLEKAFEDLLQDHCLSKTPDVIEVSRFAIDPNMTERRQKDRTIFLLHYLLYLWMQRNKMRYAYLVSTHKLIASVRHTRRVPVITFGRQAKTHDNKSYQAAYISMHEIMDWRNRTKYFLRYLFI